MTGREVGRPDEYRPHYCDLVVEEMSKGYSLGAVAGLIGVARDTLTKWKSRYPEFLLAVKRGKAKRLRQWETIALGVASGQIKGNAGVIALGLKNAGDGEWFAGDYRPPGAYDFSVLSDAQFASLGEILEVLTATSQCRSH